MDNKESKLTAEKELEIALTTYIALKHSQEECAGFIDGFKEAIKLTEEVSKQRVLEALERVEGRLNKNLQVITISELKNFIETEVEHLYNK